MGMRVWMIRICSYPMMRIRGTMTRIGRTAGPYSGPLMIRTISGENMTKKAVPGMAYRKSIVHVLRIEWIKAEVFPLSAQALICGNMTLVKAENRAMTNVYILVAVA